jgi:capsular exopolysaccharide synthesis family protein
VQHQNALVPYAPPAPQADDNVSTLQIFTVIWRRRYGILLTGILLSILTAGAVMQMRPSFVATASVLMQEHKTSATDLPTTSGTIATDSVAVRTQADILRSPMLARQVVRELHLLDLPEFTPHPGLWTRVMDALRAADGFGILKWLGLDDATPPQPPSLQKREEYAAKVLMGMTSIVNDGRSYVLDIRVKVSASETRDAAEAAALSADLANGLADAYVQFTGNIKSDNIRHANALFDERIATLRQKMETAEHDVQAYRVANGLQEDRAASIDGRTVTIVNQQMARLNLDLTAAIADRAKKEASLEQITNSRPGSGDLQSVPEVVGSPLIQHLREQQSELGTKEAAIAMNHGTGSPDLMAVRASQRDVAAKIAAETANIGASLRSAVAAARTTENALRAQLAQLQGQVGVQGETEIRLNQLQNQADVAKMLYTAYLKGSEETANQIDIQEPDAVVVSRAGIPLGEAPPARQTLAAVSVLLSFCAAVLLALIAERRQSGFRTPEQLEAVVGLGTLGFVPKVRNVREAMRFGDTKTMFSEAIFSIRALLRLNNGAGSKVIMVTSAVPQEGKTLLSSSLARNAALAGERVLLMDCDLRRPAVAKYIAATDTHVLEDVTIRRDTLSSLEVITLTSGQRSPQDLFASPHMEHLISMLRTRYDLIVLDAPPVLAVSDARVLSVLADVTVLAVCWRTTPQKLVARAVSELRESGAKLSGTVMTQINLNELKSSDSTQAYLRHYYAKYVPS